MTKAPGIVIGVTSYAALQYSAPKRDCQLAATNFT
jgi:hypothetical protein